MYIDCTRQWACAVARATREALGTGEAAASMLGAVLRTCIKVWGCARRTSCTLATCAGTRAWAGTQHWQSRGSTSCSWTPPTPLPSTLSPARWAYPRPGSTGSGCKIHGKFTVPAAFTPFTRFERWGLAQEDAPCHHRLNAEVKDVQAYRNALFVCVQLYCAELLHFHGGQQRLHSLEHPACLPAAPCYATVPNHAVALSALMSL